MMQHTIIKRNVKFSTYCFIISTFSTLILVGIFFYNIYRPVNRWATIALGVLIILLFLSTIFYMPLSISVDSKNLNINRPLRVKSLPLSEIADIKLLQPTMAAKRLCGSGGWFGWYGYFSEPDLGKYFAYYGKASDCFLVTLKNNKKYMLGCADSHLLVDKIKSML